MYTQSVDLYAFGIILWEVLEGKAPWDDEKVYAIRKQVLRGNRPATTTALVATAPKYYAALMIRCWDHSPDLRPSFDQVHAELQDMQVRLHADAAHGNSSLVLPVGAASPVRGGDSKAEPREDAGSTNGRELKLNPLSVPASLATASRGADHLSASSPTSILAATPKRRTIVKPPTPAARKRQQCIGFSSKAGSPSCLTPEESGQGRSTSSEM